VCLKTEWFWLLTLGYQLFTKATAGSIVADKNCEKVEYISPNIYCAGAGTAADLQYVKCTIDLSSFDEGPDGNDEVKHQQID